MEKKESNDILLSVLSQLLSLKTKKDLAQYSMFSGERL